MHGTTEVIKHAFLSQFIPKSYKNGLNLTSKTGVKTWLCPDLFGLPRGPRPQLQHLEQLLVSHVTGVGSG